MKPRITLVIPAHNEAAFLPSCLDAVEKAAEQIDTPVEVIVVLNRCTDATAVIARDRGCITVLEDAKNLSVIRNAGAAVAKGEIIVTCDADSRMHVRTFSEILRRLDAGFVIGGGAMVLPERWSPGIIASGISILPYLAFAAVSFGLFWCRKSDFEAIGGFDERFISVEDLDFARRLKMHGRKSGRRWDTLFSAPLVTSCRKFDQFGDWYLFRNPAFVRRLFHGHDRKASDAFWYDIRSD